MRAGSDAKRVSVGLGAERLERRDLPAGVVQCWPNYAASTLEIRGDTFGNAVEVTRLGDWYRVTPFHTADGLPTTVTYWDSYGRRQSTSGAPAWIQASRLRNVSCDMSAGVDLVRIGQWDSRTRTEVVGDLRVLTGAGGDLVQIVNVNVSGTVIVNTDGMFGSAPDNDTVSLGNVYLARTVSIATGIGSDSVDFTNATCRERVTVSLGTGIDQLTLNQSWFYSLMVLTDPASKGFVLGGPITGRRFRG